MAAADTYFPIKAGPVRIGVTWSNDIHNSGWYVLVSDMGSNDRRRCTVGTSSFVNATKPLVKAAETGYQIRIVQVKDNRVVSNKTVCVIAV